MTTPTKLPEPTGQLYDALEAHTYQAKGIMALEPPTHLPLAELISSARQKRSLSLSAVAREMQRAAQEEGIHCGATRQAILGYERGRIPHPDALRWLASAIGLPVDELAAAGRRQRSHRRAVHLIASAIRATHDPNSGTLDEDMERRELLGFLTRAAKAGLLASGLRHLPTVTSSVVIEDDSIEAVVSISRGYRRLWYGTPNHDLTGSVKGHLRLISRLLASAGSEREKATLAEAASETALVAAWLAEDQWQLDVAAEHHRLSRSYAERSQNVLLQVYVAGITSDWATRRGQGAEAVSLVEQARKLLPREVPPLAHAWVAVRQGTAYAVAHDRPAALAALTRAERAFDKAKTGDNLPWPWFFPISHHEITRYRGLAATPLRMFDMGIPALSEGLDAFAAFPKRRAYTLGKLAEAYAHTGETEQACELGAEAFTIATQFGDNETLLTVRKVRLHLEPMRATQAVKQLDERLLSSLMSLPQSPQI